MLNPQEFPSRLYHGTVADLKPGDKILPGRVAGHSVHGTEGSEYGEPARDHAFASSDEDWAWEYASFAEQDHEERTGRTSRGRVYRVKPHPETRRGLSGYDYEYVAPHFEVVDRIDVKPPKDWEHQGRQGTLPLNWAQFAKKVDPAGYIPPFSMSWDRSTRRINTAEEINHPSPGNPGWAQERADGVRGDRVTSHPATHPGQGKLF